MPFIYILEIGFSKKMSILQPTNNPNKKRQERYGEDLMGASSKLEENTLTNIIEKGTAAFHQSANSNEAVYKH